MESLRDFILKRNTNGSKTKLLAILKWAKTHGAIIVRDHRSRGVSMEPCSAWLAVALHRLGVRVVRKSCLELWRSARPFTQVVFCFCNLWAMSPSQRHFPRVKAGPWVALQTEHKGFRVYERPQCHYRWFLKRCDQVWDFGFDFCEGSSSLFLPTMWHPLTMMPPSRPPKTKDVVFLGKEEGVRRKVRQALRNKKDIQLFYANNLPMNQSMGVYRTALIGLMIPRQAGNFEFHRFSAYAVSYTRVVALLSPKMDEGLAKLLAPMVDFVKTPEAMVERVKELLKDRKALEDSIDEGVKWFKDQRLNDLLKDLYEDLAKTTTESTLLMKNLKTVLNKAKTRQTPVRKESLFSYPKPKKTTKKTRVQSKMMRLLAKLH